MSTPDIDELIDRLEEARDAGQPLTVEQVCIDYPELLEPLRKRWAALRHFDDRFRTQAESPEEIERKLSMMPGQAVGSRLVMQAELHLNEFHDCGGLGEVYEATDQSLSRRLAVKLLRKDRQLPANLEDFRREAQIIGLLNHPGIVSIVGWGETFEGRPFYAMPFVDRGNLLASSAAFHAKHPHRIDDSDKDFRDLIYRLTSVCKTIAYAHSRSIVHRDLKPENVMLGKYGETLVIDWGCATRVMRDARFKMPGEQTVQLKGLNDSTSSGGMTLRYASPEQLHGGKSVGPESDIYSLGAILYRLLVGKSPYENVPNEQVCGLSMAGKLEPAESLKAGIPKPLAAICQKAMSVAPNDRYETAMAMADDLERYLSDASVSVCRTSVGTKMARFVRRNRTASALLLGMLLISTALLTIALAGQSVFALKAKTSARERLSLAATMAANIGGFEIDRRISLLEHEAQSPELVSLLTAIADNPSDRNLWDKTQILMYEFEDLLMQSGVEVESMFLNDVRGTQVARVSKTDSIGENFAYRNYFHGLPEDLDPLSPDYVANPPGPAPGVVVSNAYVSTNQDRDGQYPIKTAFSVPVVSVDSAKARRVVGRLGMSVRVNDLGIFEGLSNLSADACLVEMREYEWGSGTARGLILDRKLNSQRTFAVPAQSSSPAAVPAGKLSSEAQVQDSMPRLSPDSIEHVLAVVESRSDSNLIPGFHDSQINPTRLDAASAAVRLPYREGTATGWAVIFYEAEDTP
jgi:serine/threonine protein kinase